MRGTSPLPAISAGLIGGYGDIVRLRFAPSA